MTLALATPVVGGLQTGMTTPSWTVVADTANTAVEKQWQVTALASGSAAGARFHSISDPATITFMRPSVLKTLSGLISGLTGLYGRVPSNMWTRILLVRKGVNIAANNVPRIMTIRVECDVPAGADSYDSPNVRMAASLAVGVLNQLSAGFGDTLVSGSI
jgi:hypothetical protein